jgi:hypothetical protein
MKQTTITIIVSGAERESAVSDIVQEAEGTANFTTSVVVAQETEEVEVSMQSVSSSNVVAVGYDAEARELTIEFSAGIYTYSGVEVETYEMLMASSSIGSYVARSIKPCYSCTKLG